VVPLEEATERLGRAWGVVNHLNHVADTPELRAVYNENQPKVTEFWTELGQNEALFDKYKALRASPAFVNLTPARKRIVENALRDFRLGGAELPETRRNASPRSRNSTPRSRRASRKTCSTRPTTTSCWSKTKPTWPACRTTPSRRARRRRSRRQDRLPVHAALPVLLPGAAVCRQPPAARNDLPRQRHQGLGHGRVFSELEKWDNTSNIAQLLKLRDEEAKLLDYRNFAEVSLVPKMAESPEHVIAFLEDLARRARPFAEKDLAELRAFAKDELGIADMQAWDVTYASEKLREQRYAFSAQEVKEYFPEPKVVAGLFKVVQKLFSVRSRRTARRSGIRTCASTASSATASWSASSTSTCTRAPARARAPGWTTRAAAA
jgi:oligopeptidase A